MSSPPSAEPTRHAPARTSLVVRRLSVALGVLVALLALSPVASAQSKLSLDVDAAFPAEGDSETGWGAGVRYGHAWNVLVLAFIPEIGGGYHTFGGSPDARALDGVIGMRFGLNFIVEPSVFAHVGVGHFEYTAASRDISETGFKWDAGAAFDLTLLPVIDLGAHVAYAQIAGGSVDPFASVNVGGHITFTLGGKKKD
jgi:hypothetical protein